MTVQIPAGEFEARCLQVMDEVEGTGREVVIPTRGRPVEELERELSVDGE